jgi:hypothetical protein
LPATYKPSKLSMETSESTYHIHFSEELNVVIMEWKGYSTSSQFREGTELMLNTLIYHRTSKVLAEIKDMVLIGKEDQEWLIDTFLPRATRFGFKSIALVKPASYFNQVAVGNIYQKIDKYKLNIQLFDTIEQATEWLK